MKLWEKNIRKIDPYVPGEQPDLPDMIKLNTNENPYPPSHMVQKALESPETEKLRLYPDPDSTLLTKCLAEYYQLSPDQVFVGVGSDDVLAIAFMTFFNSGKPILFPDVTYSFYDVWARLFKIPYERPMLNQEYHIRKEDYYKENGGIVIANPNAPTGVYEDLEFIRDIVEHNKDVIVIVDEAYIDFGGVSALELTEEYDNLLIVQTFSKARSMAGMRIGYAMGNPELIRAMKDVRYSYNSYPMTRLSVKVGVEAVVDVDYFRKTIDTIIEVREKTKKRLHELGFSFPDSMTNFVLIEHESVPAITISQKLREKSIFVRHFNHDRIKNALRVTIGTEEEMEIFLKEVETIVAK